MSLINRRLEIKGYLTTTWARSKFVCEQILTIQSMRSRDRLTQFL